MDIIETEKRSPKLQELNKKIFELVNLIKKNKKVCVITDYIILETVNNQGEEVKYCFFNESNIDKMVIV
jgi:hypothetical protein